MSLTDEDLAYMRATQAAARPTAATWARLMTVPDGAGGRTRTWTDGDPVQVRIDGTPDQIPAEVADRLEGGTAVRLVMDLVDVRAGDRVSVSPVEVYEVVSEGDPDRWATAQVVWARRVVFPART